MLDELPSAHRPLWHSEHSSQRLILPAGSFMIQHLQEACPSREARGLTNVPTVLGRLYHVLPYSAGSSHLPHVQSLHQSVESSLWLPSKAASDLALMRVMASAVVQSLFSNLQSLLAPITH